MNIKLHKITVRDLANGYIDNNAEGIVGYGGLLDIRPQYQREYIYNTEQRNAVIYTILKGYPLNVMYWAVREDGGYEIIDGQQRTISICQYINGDFSFNGLGINNQPIDIKNRILDYELMIYHCEGSASEKLEWFRIINIAGVKLTDQELRNAVYHGLWVSDAKRYFSKSNCPAFAVGNKYLKGVAIRQEYLETVIRWISNNKIEDYMALNQHNTSAVELWDYFQKVINWVKILFPVYRREMEKIQWGLLYNDYSSSNSYISDTIETEVKTLMQDDDVQDKKGIYYYIFDRNERYLNIRVFTNSQKRTQYEKQGGICAITGVPYEIEDMEGDHIIPWSRGGKTTIDNLQMVSKEANRAKSNR